MSERDTAVRVAKEAGGIMRSAVLQQNDVEIKGHQVDLVTVYDKKVEAMVIAELQKAFPEYGFLCEESGVSNSDSSEVKKRWIVDPIDGTTSFAHGHPNHCISIALETVGQGITLAVVYAPVFGDLFVAEKGKGAFWNGERIQSSKRQDLKSCIIATGFPTYRYSIDRHDTIGNNLAYFQEMLFQVQDVRRHGSAAIDIAWVACGRQDAYFEQGLSAWDIAAGHLILTEAGGSFAHMDGSPIEYEKIITGEEKQNILASSNADVHGSILACFRSVEAKAEIK